MRFQDDGKGRDEMRKGLLLTTVLATAGAGLFAEEAMFLAIVPFCPAEPEALAAEYRRYREATGLTLLLVEMPLTPEGNDPYEKVRLYTEGFAKVKALLKDSDIRLGILLQSLIGHGWSNVDPAGKPFQTTVNERGGTNGRYCPLDPGFLRYCADAVAGLAKLSPELFLLDDDTHLIDGRLQCFCPLHRAQFSREWGERELIDAVMGAKAGDPVLEEFERVRVQSLVDFCANVRRAIDSVNPSIPCGISCPWGETAIVERLAMAAAGDKTEPFIRVNNATYFEGSQKDMARVFYETALKRAACGSVRLVLDESDTFPQTLYSKSAVGMHTHITGALLNGLGGAKLWTANFENPLAGPRNERYETVLKEHLGFYHALKAAVSRTVWKGASSALCDCRRFTDPRHPRPWSGLYEWSGDVLGRLAFPVNGRRPNDPDAECFLLTGKMVDLFRDEELQALTRRNLLLDATAAEALAARGYGDLLGVEVRKPCPQFTCERDLATGWRMRLLIDDDCRELVPAPGAEIVSQLEYIPFPGSAVSRVVAPGATLFRNRLGKTVAVWAGRPHGAYTPAPERRAWFRRILSRFCEIPASGSDEMPQDLYCMAGRMDDGAVLLALVNLSYDPLGRLSIDVAELPDAVERLAPSGKWETVAFAPSGPGTISVDVPCPAGAPVVLRLL